MIATFLAYRANDPTGLLLWPIIGFCIGIGLFIYGFRLLQRRRLILDTPFSKIRSAAMGMVEVSGLAVGPYTMNAPITGHACYYYRTVIQEYKQEGKNKRWVMVAGECMHLPFYIDDNTGRVLVDPQGADLDLHRDFDEEFCNSFFSTKDAAPPSINSFLSRHGVVTDNKIKVEECCIKPKNALFVLGTLAENPGVEISSRPLEDNEALRSVRSFGLSQSLRSISFTMPVLANYADAVQSHPEVIRLSTGPGPVKTVDMTQQQKIAAALLKAGIATPAAWSAAGLAAPQLQVQTMDNPSAPGGNGNGNASDLQSKGFDPHPPVVLMKGENNKTFLISWRSQQALARSLGWKCTLMIWGGSALALLSVYLFIAIEQLI